MPTPPRARTIASASRLALVAAALVAAAAFPGPAGAAVRPPLEDGARARPVADAGATPSGELRYVSTGGSDKASGSSTHPWRTIQYAVDTAPEGATIIIRRGTYARFTLRRSNLTVQGVAASKVEVAGGENVVFVRGVSSATIRGLTARSASKQYGAGIRIESSQDVLVEKTVLRDNTSFGMKIKDSTDVLVQANDIRRNDTGIELSGAVDGARILGNRIHDNKGMVTSSRGGNAIVFATTTGPITASGNRIYGNRARHLSGSGYDGGAFEVYNASDLTITGNRLWDNNNAMETGTDGSAPCSRILFARNIVMGKGSVAGETAGLILRCADHSTIAHNVFDGVDDYAFYLSTSGGYAGSIEELHILDNAVVRGRAYSITTDVPATVVADYNFLLPGGSSATYSDHLAYIHGHGNTDSLAELRSWTGYEANGRKADPSFVDRSGGDYHLRAASDAIDAGTVAYGESYAGSAPDVGAYETAP